VGCLPSKMRKGRKGKEQNITRDVEETRTRPTPEEGFLLGRQVLSRHRSKEVEGFVLEKGKTLRCFRKRKKPWGRTHQAK